MPTCGPDEILVTNTAVSINPVDWYMAKLGIFIKEGPAIFGCDVAGTVHAVGQNVASSGRFKVGDRVIAHTTNFVTARPQDGAFQLYTTVPATKAAVLPDKIVFTYGVVVPLALETAICALFVSQPGTALPGVPIPTLALKYPAFGTKANDGEVIVVWGGSSSVGNMTVQLATAAGITVIATSGAANFDLVKSACAADVLDHRDPDVVDKVVKAVQAQRGHGKEFVGIVDAISVAETYVHDIAILSMLGGGHLACTHPPPPVEEMPEGVEIKAGMTFAVNDAATPIWTEFVTKALEEGVIKFLPPAKVIGQGLEAIDGGLKMSEKGVSAVIGIIC